jgi:tRNA 2-thiouridine synthesizing protein B
MRCKTQPANASIALFALEEDIVARGLGNLPERVQQVDYPGFVELCCRYARTNAWL